MKYLLFFSLIFLISCSGNKYVYVCGDRECLDKKEADEYFSKNLSLEVRILNKDKDQSINLVKLNIKSSDNNLNEKSSNQKNIKTPSMDDKKLLKEQRKLAKIKIKEDKKQKKKLSKINKKKIKKKTISNKTEIKRSKNNIIYVDTNKLCADLNKCDIDEISEYLIKAGIEKEYPNITKY